MKIILSCRAYPTQRPGGMPFVCQDRARALVQAGHEVHVLTTGGDQGAGAFSDQGVAVHHLPCESQKYTRQFAEESLAKAQAIEPDILHFDGFDVNHLWWVDKPWKVGITLHGFGPGAFFTAWNFHLSSAGKPPVFNHTGMVKEARVLAKADRVIAISQHELWMLEDLYGLYGKARLVYNPIPDYFFQGAMEPSPNGPFMCIGNPGTSGNRRFDLARQTGQPVDIVRGVERSQLPARYAQARAVVVPTFWAQGFDLTVAEALACRRSVIATATGSYYREGRDNPYIQLVPRGDVEALKEAMQAPLPKVSPDAAENHRASVHVAKWLEVIG